MKHTTLPSGRLALRGNNTNEMVQLFRHDEIVKLLIDKGFAKHINRNTPSGTALWCACGNAKDRIVEILLKYGADPDVIFGVMGIIFFSFHVKGPHQCNKQLKGVTENVSICSSNMGPNILHRFVSFERVMTGAGFGDIRRKAEGKGEREGRQQR